MRHSGPRIEFVNSPIIGLSVSFTLFHPNSRMWQKTVGIFYNLVNGPIASPTKYMKINNNEKLARILHILL